MANALSWAASRGAMTRSTACSAGDVALEVRLENMRSMAPRRRPLRSSAATVLSKLGASTALAITSTSARCSASVTSKAGAKCSGCVAANGGSPYGAVQSASSGLTTLEGAVRRRSMAYFPFLIAISSFSSKRRFSQAPAKASRSVLSCCTRRL